LGAEYGWELASLLDPANGRIDIMPGDHRKAGGFSKGFPGVTTVFFSHAFEGYYNDMRVLMHESTHAVHRQLMSNHTVRAVYADGPHYLFESFAIFNELLLADYLYQHDTNPAKRQYYLEQFLDGKGMALFFIAQDAALEQAIYEAVEHGGIESADDLDALTERINRRFDIWINRHVELKMRWITCRLFYEDPLYEINYVYGSLLALKYYAMFKQAPGPFVKDYISLMGNGFDATPELLLSKFLKIDLHDPDLVTGAVKILEMKVRQLEAEY
jgi:oligoendopeptidase F